LHIVGFIGPSGTGKSHRALWVAWEHEIEFIIDDGLLVKGNKVIAGFSAKKERTKIGSIKRALFTDRQHAKAVRKKINEYKPKGILILGTSEKMVERIVKNLGFKEISEKIHINEVAEEFEIEQALTSRKEQGKHVIPVPAFEIKKEFSGYFLDPLQILRRKGKGNYQLVGEKSVVRPTFSYLGKYTISDYAIFQIVEYLLYQIEGINKISRFRVENTQGGIYMEIDLILVYGYAINPLVRKVYDKISTEIEKHTALTVKTINITIKSLVAG
jgi:uncharacterized alkaline shock family protein YloU